ncbi:MAG: hypothetical protein HY514_03645 [Candidatus Aenigmarchaeota archaeon]|nr:hypothetical protein [Candidatus Aenigmarchaeota archaeon]
MIHEPDIASLKKYAEAGDAKLFGAAVELCIAYIMQAGISAPPMELVEYICQGADHGFRRAAETYNLPPGTTQRFFRQLYGNQIGD